MRQPAVVAFGIIEAVFFGKLRDRLKNIGLPAQRLRCSQRSWAKHSRRLPAAPIHDDVNPCRGGRYLRTSLRGRRSLPAPWEVESERQVVLAVWAL